VINVHHSSFAEVKMASFKILFLLVTPSPFGAHPSLNTNVLVPMGMFVVMTAPAFVWVRIMANGNLHHPFGYGEHRANHEPRTATVPKPYDARAAVYPN